MKGDFSMKYKLILSIVTALLFGGCSVNDKIDSAVGKAQDAYENIKAKYEEYRGEDEQNLPRPFEVVFQNDESTRTTVITSECGYNESVQYVYYTTPADTQRVLYDTQNLITYPGVSLLKPFWDLRYINPMEKYINGGNYDHYPNHGEYTGLDTRTGNRNVGIGTASSQIDPAGGIAQAECVNGYLAAGTTINLNDAPSQFIYYGGPQSTFTYQLGKTSLTSPWRSDGTGNLVLQAHFDKPIYHNYGNNAGGGVYFALFLRNRNSNLTLNVIIGLYVMGDAWIQEKRQILYDPTTRIVHIATIASDDSWWCTKGTTSKALQELQSTPNAKTSDDGLWNDFYRINISYQNLLAILKELKTNPPAGAEGQNFGLNPADWDVSTVMVQYELEENGGKAVFSGSFSKFEVYISKNPIR